MREVGFVWLLGHHVRLLTQLPPGRPRQNHRGSRTLPTRLLQGTQALRQCQQYDKHPGPACRSQPVFRRPVQCSAAAADAALPPPYRLKAMRLKELRELAVSRRVSPNGRKAVLIEALTKAYEQSPPIASGSGAAADQTGAASARSGEPAASAVATTPREAGGAASTSGPTAAQPAAGAGMDWYAQSDDMSAFDEQEQAAAARAARRGMLSLNDLAGDKKPQKPNPRRNNPPGQRGRNQERREEVKAEKRRAKDARRLARRRNDAMLNVLDAEEGVDGEAGSTVRARARALAAAPVAVFALVCNVATTLFAL